MTDKQLKIIVREIAELKEFKKRVENGGFASDIWEAEEELTQELENAGEE